MTEQRYGTRKGVREILLTFDDGPNPKTTPLLLDVLAKHGVKAMFFMLGERIATSAGRKILERAHAEGHHIGNHTFSHRDLKTLDEASIRVELAKTDELIGVCGHDCRFFRPPYGASNSTVAKVVQELGYMGVMWNVDTLDWHAKYKQNGAWVDHAMDQIAAREDSIVLMHDIHPTTVDHVEALITRIKQIPNTAFALYA